MTVKGIFFDFGFVVGYLTLSFDRKYLYLDWDGIGAITRDQELVQSLRPGVRRMELEAFFVQEIYSVFVQHEQTDFIDPQTNELLLEKLHLIFSCPVNQTLVDRILTHIDTMKYITIDAEAVKIVAELKQRGFRLALVSNMMLPGKLLKAKLQKEGALIYFDDIAISSDEGFIKPHPEIFRRTLANSDLDPGEVVFVGDSYQQDVIGAKRVGLKTVWLNNRNEPRKMVMIDPPDYEITTLAELIEKPILNS